MVFDSRGFYWMFLMILDDGLVHITSSRKKGEICIHKYDRTLGNWVKEHVLGLIFFHFGTFLAILGHGQKMPIFFIVKFQKIFFHSKN